MLKNKMVAVIDLGSNTVRLVVYRIDKNYTYSEKQNIKIPLRLYQYLDKDKDLSQQGIAQLIATFKVFSKIIAHYQVEKVIPVATAVMRQAKNQVEIFEEVFKQTGISLRLLSDKEEAFYGQLAISHFTQFDEAYTVDMGGGSTEVTYYRDNAIVHSHSFPFGVVTLKTLFFDNPETPVKKAIDKCQAFIKTQFAAHDWIKPSHLPIIAIGGSARNMAAVYQRMIDYPISGIHGYAMTEAQITETRDFLLGKTLSELKNLDGLSKDRADIIIPAVAMFLTLYRQVKATHFYLCNQGLREALLIEAINQEKPESYPATQVGTHAIARFIATNKIDQFVAEQRLAQLTKFSKLLVSHQLIEKNKTFMTYLKYGALLYLVGSFIENEDSSMHTFYLVANCNIDGFDHKERITIALLASYKNKSLFNQYLKPFAKWFSKDEILLIQKAGNLIKFCEALNLTHINQIVDLKLVDKQQRYHLQIAWAIDPIAEHFRAERQKKCLEHIVGKKVVIDFYEKGQKDKEKEK
ncbi:MAG: Ppx/GppA family phosphatase [Streptococcaceae bacterium]|jgi:exopolyphosphatase/guanosine-5'-triphosphate,3'-diphosphate pyrophosphatase|nr:Ppx/GppA family phosphatase [Streptococcaceae bacterium]